MANPSGPSYNPQPKSQHPTQSEAENPQPADGTLQPGPRMGGDAGQTISVGGDFEVDIRISIRPASKGSNAPGLGGSFTGITCGNSCPVCPTDPPTCGDSCPVCVTLGQGVSCPRC